MITNVMDFDAKVARDVMTRKKKIIGIREEMSIEEHMEYYLSQGIDKKEAIKRLKYEKPNLQMCFRTQKAINCLQKRI